MARRTPHHAERPQDRRVPLTWTAPPSESPGKRVPPQAISGSASGQHEPRKAPGSRGVPQRRHFSPAETQRPPPDESPGNRVPPQRDFWKRSGQHEPRKAPGSRGALHRRHFIQPGHSHHLPKAREAGASTGDFWKRSGQHEPRKVPASRARLIEGTPLHQRPLPPQNPRDSVQTPWVLSHLAKSRSAPQSLLPRPCP